MEAEVGSLLSERERAVALSSTNLVFTNAQILGERYYSASVKSGQSVTN
eukprot:SAG31_NODE_2768_length_5121_cov_2.322581_2_plen_48_part_01